MSKILPMPLILEIPNMNVSEVLRHWLYRLYKGLSADESRLSGLMEHFPESNIDGIVKVPDKILLSPEWKTYLFELRKTGRARDDKRYKVVLDWMWVKVLPLVGDLAQASELQELWDNMLATRDTSVVQSTISSRMEKEDPSLKGMFDQNKVRLAKVIGRSDELYDAADKEMDPYNQEMQKYQRLGHAPAKKIELMVRGVISQAVCLLNVAAHVDDFWEKVDIATCFRDAVRLDVPDIKI